MIAREKIIESIPKVLTGIDLEGGTSKASGKVRDFYSLADKRITITTDRQSAFDVILGAVPYKGAVLNELSAFWFEQTSHIVPNHMIALPDYNVLVSKEAQAIPVEMIVRGYMSGVTNTSIWSSYSKGERTIYGLKFPDGLVKNQQLPQPVITPTTHGGGASGHDERLMREEIIQQGIVPEDTYAQMEAAALGLFEFGSQLAHKQGLILVDTKYEFGLIDGRVHLIDEVHTPDSSRFWKADTYEERFSQGLEPENFDKEFLRLWYKEQGYSGEGTPPPMSEDLTVAMSERYITIYEMLTGETFPDFDYPAEERIKNNVAKYLAG